MSLRLRSWFPVCCTAAFLAVGCSEGTPLHSPTSPTGPEGFAALATTASFDGGAATFLKGGNGNGNGGNKGQGGGEDDSLEVPDDQNQGVHGHRGMLSGFVTEVGADFIVIRDIHVTIDPVTTIIRHGNRLLAITDILVGDHAQARGTMNPEGELVATEVKVEHTDKDLDDSQETEEQETDEEEDEDGQAKVEGVVTGVDGTCPKKTFKIGETTVTTDASTKYKGVTCDTLANDTKVEVKGTPQGDGILATRIELED